MSYVIAFALGCVCGAVIGGVVLILAVAAGLNKKGIRL